MSGGAGRSSGGAVDLHRARGYLARRRHQRHRERQAGGAAQGGDTAAGLHGGPALADPLAQGDDGRSRSGATKARPQKKAGRSPPRARSPQPAPARPRGCRRRGGRRPAAAPPPASAPRGSGAGRGLPPPAPPRCAPAPGRSRPRGRGRRCHWDAWRRGRRWALGDLRRQPVQLGRRDPAQRPAGDPSPAPVPANRIARRRPCRCRPHRRTRGPTKPRLVGDGQLVDRGSHPRTVSRHPVGRRSTRFDVSTVALRNRPHGDRRERRWPPSAQIVAPARRGAKAPKLPAVGRVSWRPSRVTRASQNSAYERRGCRSYTPTRSPLAKRSAPFPYADHHADNLVAGAPATASARSARCRERGGRRGRRRKHGPDQDLAEPPGPDPSAAAPHRLARRPSPHRLLRGVAMGPVALPVPHTYS